VTIHTPPCTQAIIAAGIRRVVVASQDPNPLVGGRGVEQLRAAGIEVVTGIETAEADRIIQPFRTFITSGRPYVTAKWAMTLDGKMASHTGDAYWISGPTARTWVHNLRDRVDAIMIGSGTVHADNPQLTVRLTPETREYERAERQGPIRVILATNGQLASHLNVIQPALATGTYILVGENSAPEQHQRLRDLGLTVIPLPLDAHEQIDIAAALTALAQQGIMHVLLEGGAKVLGSAFDQALIDHVAAFIAPKLIGGTGAPSPLQGSGLAQMHDAIPLHQVSSRSMDEDLLIEGELTH
jgi:diaminohydroxyphosphoribosylaminopyrimidine deaminase/5-amino-6-(5-phosphoribosylamino)uracil reductase